MKSVLRTTFDPLPRSLSTPGLIALVAVVVLGTAVTVHRYLESSSVTERRTVSGASHAATSRPSEVRAAANEESTAPKTPCPFFGSCGDTRTESSTGGTESTTSATPACAAPSIYRPEDNSVGG